ncbi:M23 family metallopeptidase [Actinoplanes sp. NEAU-A12]|uniref:M23 family metallopeptidase n=1 Tax=Actinoplanes sandaracinus TaxID=3045177 RepID=A0ABT6WTU7_9ACTN|nr:M23 family metallopeptidase [Actinoplanes sandaracinus]MDI6103164.1 M23 family metallopeptidase [Actinoplanes sandaracinus]
MKNPQVKRAIARWQTWWIRLFVLTVLVSTVVPLPVPRPWDLALTAVPLVLAFVRAPRSPRPAVDLAPPVHGRWVALNSPGTAVPSHGVRAYGQTYAVDLLRPSPGAPATIGWSLRTRPPESYPCFGAPVLAMAPGTVIRATDTQRDHRSRDTWPALLWMMTVEAFARELAGVSRILGNHVIVEHDDGTWAAYAHLRHGSAQVRPGDRVTAGRQLAEVGNTGNTSEPHLHVQLMDDPHPPAAAGIPMRWPALITDGDDRDPRWATGEPKPTAQPGFPQNGQVLEVVQPRACRH